MFEPLPYLVELIDNVAEQQNEFIFYTKKRHFLEQAPSTDSTIFTTVYYKDLVWLYFEYFLKF